MTNHLDNVCIMQKYNDSEKVLELRKEFNESETYIKKCVNMHEELIEALQTLYNEVHNTYPEIHKDGHWQYSMVKAEQALSKSNEV